MLSFFAVILCYSLFFDRSENQKHVDEVNYTIPSGAYETFQVPDSVPYYVYRVTSTGEAPTLSPERGYFLKVTAR
jgi:hypothetical protein